MLKTRQLHLLKEFIIDGSYHKIVIMHWLLVKAGFSQKGLLQLDVYIV
jgi:hypothetical protein